MGAPYIYIYIYIYDISRLRVKEEFDCQQIPYTSAERTKQYQVYLHI